MRSKLVRGALPLLAAAALGAPEGARAQAFRPSLAVVQLNDVYRIDAVEEGRAGGLGRVVTVVERTKAETGLPVRVFHAGDMIAPSLESQYFEGRQMIDALNFVHAAAPLVVVPGNHEFDSSRPGMLAGAIRRSRFPWLAANVALNTGDAAVDARLQRDTVFEANGVRVGVFSLTFLDRPRSYATHDSAFVRIAEERIRALEGRADVIVGLTHLALETDREIARLRRRHPKLVWIAGGHEHFLIREEMTRDAALITKGDSNARRVWRVTLGREGRRAAARAEAVALNESVAVDSAYRRQVTDVWMDSLRAVLPVVDDTIGRTAVRMDASEDVVRNAESAWGNWLTDLMRTAFPSDTADIAVLNGGALRIDDVLPEGPIRYEHLARSFGFPTRVALVTLAGSDVRAMLENSVSGGRGEGRFLQVSGLKVRFDRSRPEGQRVLDAQVCRGDACAPLDPARAYRVAVPDYLFGDGDGYTFRARATNVFPPGPELRLTAFDALLTAYSRGQAISPRVEGRLVDATPGAQHH
ncbi:MAG TPA: 5'-nucleotidase C-terminal domain-containing protein [Longimicrobium sp.]|nr:5'-nucleotidase C-terminal domain-containing protein [Longimicrobium sp.]